MKFPVASISLDFAWLMNPAVQDRLSERDSKIPIDAPTILEREKKKQAAVPKLTGQPQKVRSEEF